MSLKLKVTIMTLLTLVRNISVPIQVWGARLLWVLNEALCMLPPEKHLAFYKGISDSGGQKHDYSVADLTGKGVTIYTRKQD